MRDTTKRSIVIIFCAHPCVTNFKSSVIKKLLIMSHQWDSDQYYKWISFVKLQLVYVTTVVSTRKREINNIISYVSSILCIRDDFRPKYTNTINATYNICFYKDLVLVTRKSNFPKRTSSIITYTHTHTHTHTHLIMS